VRVKAGLVTFDFPPQYRRTDVAVRPTAVGSPLAQLLEARGVEVLAPLANLAAHDPKAVGGIRDGKDLALCVEALKSGRLDCLLIEVFHWCRLSLVTQLVNEVDVPTAVYANTGEGWNGVPTATAICGSLRETPRTRNAALVEGFLDADGDQDLFRWVAGVAVLARVRRSRVMLWGGSYGAEMPYTRSDPSALEALLLGEVMTEQEEVLVEGAHKILRGAAHRVDAFLGWLKSHGAAVRYDGKMITQNSLAFQVALYLAARDRLAELASDGVAGASIKCHYEMSTTSQGCTACLLPAFLPFGVDAEGPQPIIPFACEGDLNGLASLVLLQALNPGAPPLFGDLVAYRTDHVLLRNCGASAVYWAGRSGDPARSLNRVSLEPNLHGRSGAAVHYETPGCNNLGPDRGGVTFLRLFRESGRFAALLGEGRVLAESDESRYADPWPHTRLALGSSTSLLFKAIPCNHGSITEGTLAREVEICCAYAGIPVYRCDGDEGLRSLLRDRRNRGRNSQEWV
jgi:L-fucose isomerase-like protein